MNQNTNYSFTAATTDNANRFQLLFMASPLGTSNAIVQNTSIYAYENNTYINSNEVIQQIYIYNMPGQLIKTIENPKGKEVINMMKYVASYYIEKW